MTAAIHPTPVRRQPLHLGNGSVLAAMVVVATALTLVLNAGTVGVTMGGGFGDPDDAMRLVEVRDWLAGQSWFDMRMARLDPPHGSVMHWSRLVDLPTAAAIRLFSLFTANATAERLAANAVPTLWLVALYAAMAQLATTLVGRQGRLPALVGTFLGGATLVQFMPGRIGHHAPETVALLAAVATAAAALDPLRARWGFACGVAIAASLAMSLETLPFLVVLTGGLVALWIWDGVSVARALRWFSAGLLAALPLFFILTVGPGRWVAPVCDAFGAAHLDAGMIGAAGMLGLDVATPRLTMRWQRALAAGFVASLALADIVFAYPACLHSPFAGVDPLVRSLWLDHVVESQPLTRFIAARPFLGTAIVAPVGLGFVGCLVAAVGSDGVAARRFLLVAALSGAGLAMAFWQVRTLGSVTPLALCGGIYGAVALRRILAGSRGASLLASAAILPFCSTVWLLVLPADARTPAASAESEAKLACLSPRSLAPLAALPPGTALAPIDSGSHLLQATSLGVFAAPYHRNDDGNRFAFEAFLAAPEVARSLLAARRVTYVITCPGTSDMRHLAERAPGGFAARLAAGATPPFLEAEDVGQTSYRVYRVIEGK